MGENSSRRQSKFFNWILNNFTLCWLWLWKVVDKLCALPTIAKCLVVQLFKACIYPAVLGSSPWVTGRTFDPVGFFCMVRSSHYSYFPLWSTQGSQSERKGCKKAANLAPKGRRKSRKYWKWLVELTMERLSKMYFILKWNLLCFSVQHYWSFFVTIYSPFSVNQIL